MWQDPTDFKSQGYKVSEGSAPQIIQTGRSGKENK